MFLFALANVKCRRLSGGSSSVIPLLAMWTFRRSCVIPFVLVGIGCGGSDSTPPANTCEAFAVPARVDTSACSDVSASDPLAFLDCLRGSGHAGRWVVDAHGLPAYDFALEQRCDPAATAYSPRPYPLRDPVHQIGNGRGLVAMAHASGGVEIYMQDRGHAWVNRVDTWDDDSDPSFPHQLGGGFSYVVDAGRVKSTRFEDLPIASATLMQSRRFGMGYVETTTDHGSVRVTRRVFAPAADARALVAEVRLENPSAKERTYELVEVWDPNLYDVRVELVTSDFFFQGTTSQIDHNWRANNAVSRSVSRSTLPPASRARITAKALPTASTTVAIRARPTGSRRRFSSPRSMGCDA